MQGGGVSETGPLFSGGDCHFLRLRRKTRPQRPLPYTGGGGGGGEEQTESETFAEVTQFRARPGNALPARRAPLPPGYPGTFSNPRGEQPRPETEEGPRGGAEGAEMEVPVGLTEGGGRTPSAPPPVRELLCSRLLLSVVLCLWRCRCRSAGGWSSGELV